MPFSAGNQTCAGGFSCRQSKVCIPPSQVCDGYRHCPLADDEINCDVICPRDCTCRGLTVFCPDASLVEVPMNLHPNLKKLDLSNNDLVSVNSSDLMFHWLGELILSYNQIGDLGSENFVDLVNLYLLDLSFNKITILKIGVFTGLEKLLTLNLLGNTELSVIEPGCFVGLNMLPSLVLKGMSIKFLGAETFDGLENVALLDLSGNNITTIDEIAFEGLRNVNHLNISSNQIEVLPKIAITFPDGSSDTMILNKYFSNEDDRRTGFNKCNFIGHLEKETGACIG